MQINMIVTDLDGTLLDGGGTLSPATARALALYRERGVPIVYATARPLRLLEPLMKAYPCDGLVYNNGAVVQDKDGRRTYTSIASETARSTMERLRSAFPGIELSADINDLLYRTFKPIEQNRYAGILTDIAHLPTGQVHKISFDRRAYPDLSVFTPYLPKEIYLQPCEERLAFLMHRRATKLRGVERLRKAFGIDPQTVVAFGDDVNDIAMLAHYYGVAMANGTQEVRHAAREVTLRNDQDGVAAFLLGNKK